MIPAARERFVPYSTGPSGPTARQNGEGTRARSTTCRPVLRFDPGTVAKLTEAAETAGSGASGPSGRATVAERPWFPDAVKARVAKAGDGGRTVRGHAIDAEAMFRPRYSIGSALRVEGTDYVVLVAQTS